MAFPFAAANGSTAPATAPGAPGSSLVPDAMHAGPATAAPSPPMGVPVQAGPPPQIVPNCRRLDNHFPTLAFNIRTLGRPWFEVLLATDLTLFSPANAGRRVPGNFYASREHGGLSRADTEDVAYVVPASVLRRFADARPRPAQIYYAVAAYPAPDVPPTLSQPVESLAQSAPWVALGADFAAQTMATVLGIPVEKLHRVEQVEPATTSVELDDDGIPVGESTSWSSERETMAAEAAAALAWAQDDSRAVAELETAPPASPPPSAPVEEAERWSDGPAADAWAADVADYAPVDPMQADDADVAYEAPEEEMSYDAPDAEMAYNAPDAEMAYNAPDAEMAYDAPDTEMAYDAPDAEMAYEAPDEELAYDDGFGGPPEETWAHAEESEFPAGAVEPAELPDDHDHIDDDLRQGPAARQAEYGDEAMGFDLGSPAATPPGPPAAAPVAPGPAAQAPPAAPVPPGAPAPASTTAPFTGPVLTEDAKIGLLHKIGHRFETSRHHAYGACERDLEFSNPNLSQYQRWHVGLTYGFFGFTQDSGSLGHLLERFKRADEASFRRIFGPHADELIAVTTAHGPEGRHVPGGRSARVQPVAGHDLWEDEWVHRFEAAGEVPTFQREQDRMAVAHFVDPMIPMATAFGMDTERALGMLVDRAGHQGVGGATRWLLRAMSPLRTDAVRQQALAALGVPGLREFQHAHGLHADGEFGPRTHIELARAVRQLGHGSPVPFPTREQLMHAIVAVAEHEQVWWRRRPREMRTAPEFGDVPLTLTQGPEPVSHRP